MSDIITDQRSQHMHAGPAYLTGQRGQFRLLRATFSMSFPGIRVLKTGLTHEHITLLSRTTSLDNLTDKQWQVTENILDPNHRKRKRFHMSCVIVPDIENISMPLTSEAPKQVRTKVALSPLFLRFRTKFSPT